MIPAQADAAKAADEAEPGAAPNASTAEPAEEKQDDGAEKKAEEERPVQIETLEIKGLKRAEAGLGLDMAFRYPPPSHMVHFATE